MIKFFKKLLVAATVVCSAGIAATAAGCNIETDHPGIKISVEFNGETYELDYTLYRNMYPNTVRHFIELTENGLYNNLIYFRRNGIYRGEGFGRGRHARISRNPFG